LGIAPRPNYSSYQLFFRPLRQGSSAAAYYTSRSIILSVAISSRLVVSFIRDKRHKYGTLSAMWK
jgi:ubiquinone biosynthesis protein COQ9